MVVEWKANELIALVREHYPDWDNFEHPQFVADEISYKQATIQKARSLLSQKALDTLLADGAYELFVEHLDKLAKDNNLLWRLVPSSGDTAVLYHQNLDTPTFCTHMRNLLYGDRPTPQRLQTFSDYLKSHNLPNKWPFATYFLFLCHPQTEMFVKPRTTRWFLKFMSPEGLDSPQAPQTKVLITMQPSAASYAVVLEQAKWLRDALVGYGARDMVDVQSLIWVCESVSRERIGRLDKKGQVELDVPPSPPAPATTYDITTQPVALKETDANGPAQGSHSQKPALQDTSKSAGNVYTLATCTAETGFDEAELGRWLRAIERKGQAIFYGPPGTGKTFMAQKLAQHLVSQGNGFQELVQFHPAYAYEEFVQGIRPFTDDFGNLHYNLVPGRFLDFCAKAGRRTGPCVLIIDEINRANLASVLGELMYLLEYRQAEAPLAGGGKLRIPANVRLIGTMNTADRSIALVDHALRRRFAFIHLRPNYQVLRHYHRQSAFKLDPLIQLLKRLNNEIDDPHYHIGITYFMHPDLGPQLPDIWQMEIEPYLEEYFFDQPDQVNAFRWPQVRKQLAG